MRKATIISAVISIVCCSACSTLPITEITNLAKKDFDSLELKPGIEPNELRVDIVRRKFEQNNTDSTQETKLTPYHPLGFNLGNGLFYDLNGNLSLRIDYLLGYSMDHDFEIEMVTRPKKNKGVIRYSFCNDSLVILYPPKERVHYKYHRTKLGDSLSFMHNKRLDYAIVKNDSSVAYRGKRRVWNCIYQLDSQSYYLDKKRKKRMYQEKGQEIYLEDDYVIAESCDKKTIEIKRHGWKTNKTLFTMIKGDRVIFIYTNKYFGMKLAYQENHLFIYQNNLLTTKYKLIKKQPVAKDNKQ